MIADFGRQRVGHDLKMQINRRGAGSGCLMVVTANSVAAAATNTIAAPGARNTPSSSPGTGKNFSP